jgi:hypothetical protein
VNSERRLQNSLLSYDSKIENPKKEQKLQCTDATRHQKHHSKTINSLPLHANKIFLIEVLSF